MQRQSCMCCSTHTTVHAPHLCQQQDDGQEGIQAQTDAAVASRPNQPCGCRDECEQPRAKKGVDKPVWRQLRNLRGSIKLDSCDFTSNCNVELVAVVAECSAPGHGCMLCCYSCRCRCQCDQQVGWMRDIRCQRRRWAVMVRRWWRQAMVSRWRRAVVSGRRRWRHRGGNRPPVHLAVHVHRVYHHGQAQQRQQCVRYLQRHPAEYEAAAMQRTGAYFYLHAVNYSSTTLNSTLLLMLK
jgi:hypothetical protein